MKKLATVVVLLMCLAKRNPPAMSFKSHAYLSLFILTAIFQLNVG